MKVVYATFFICRKLNYPSVVKFYGAALHKEGEQLKAVLVMELCKENLMRHILRHKSNVRLESHQLLQLRKMRLDGQKTSPMLWNTFTDKVSFTEISSWKIYW